MKLSEFNYNLPRELIAQSPINPRDHSQLLILDKRSGDIKHKHFYNIVDYLHAGDVLVLNNSKVFPARLIGKKKKTGGKIEVFILQPSSLNPSPTHSSRERGARGVWQCLLGGRGARQGLEIIFGRQLECVVEQDNRDGTWQVKFNKFGQELMKVVNKIGLTPLPPYIKKDQENKKIKKQESKDYQTVYADDKKIGSVAAPTAGFHFTPRLIKKLKNKGVQFEYITLHVGLGTFAPVKADDITKHKMHAEWVEVKKSVLQRIAQAKQDGRKIIAVGTTSVRTLEAIAEKFSIFNFQFSNNDQYSMIKIQKELADFKQFVDIFIYPGFKFKVVDAMITNFHLPKSTLLMLVSAFAGKDNVDKAYKNAIKKKYRFYSYGDAMLIY